MVGCGIVRLVDVIPAQQTENPKEDFDNVFAKELQKKQVDKEDYYFVFFLSYHYYLDVCLLKTVAKIVQKDEKTMCGAKKDVENFGCMPKTTTFASLFGGRASTEAVSMKTLRWKTGGNSSVGRAQPCQGWGREFESRFPLKRLTSILRSPRGGMVDALVSGASVERRASSILVVGTEEDGEVAEW